MSKYPIASVLTLMFMTELGVTDNIDLMRCNILAMEIERVEHTIDSIKETSAYKGCIYDVYFDDSFLQSLLDRKLLLLS